MCCVVVSRPSTDAMTTEIRGRRLIVVLRREAQMQSVSMFPGSVIYSKLSKPIQARVEEAVTTNDCE